MWCDVTRLCRNRGLCTTGKLPITTCTKVSTTLSCVMIASTRINSVTNCQLISHTHLPQLLLPSPTLLHTFCDSPQLFYGQLGLYQLQKVTGKKEVVRRYPILGFWEFRRKPTAFRGWNHWWVVQISPTSPPPLTYSYIEPPPTPNLVLVHQICDSHQLGIIRYVKLLIPF